LATKAYPTPSSPFPRQPGVFDALIGVAHGGAVLGDIEPEPVEYFVDHPGAPRYVSVANTTQRFDDLLGYRIA